MPETNLDVASRGGIAAFLPLHTPRLTIRPFQLADAEALYQLHRSPQVTRYAGGTKTREESHRSLVRIIERVSSTGLGALALEEPASKDVVGWCGIQRMRDLDELEILYALSTQVWGQGLAYEAASAVIAVAFQQQNPPPDGIFGLVFPQNIRSIRVLEKLGMHFLRNHYDANTGRHACLYLISRRRFLDSYSSSSK